MNKRDASQSDLDSLLQQALKDDLPPEAEARMARQFRNLAGILDRVGDQAECCRWLWLRGVLRKEILAFAWVVLLIFGGMVYLSGNQSVLADSIERLKMIVTVSAEIRRATTMDCAVLMEGRGYVASSYRVRWGMTGNTRIDIDASDGKKQTVWIQDEAVLMAPYARFAVRSPAGQTIPRNAVWRPAAEFLTPAMLARRIEEQYGLQVKRRDERESDAFLLVGQENQWGVEITVDATTYLPVLLKKYPLNASRSAGEQTCIQVRFQWNRPILRELLTPKFPERSMAFDEQ